MSGALLAQDATSPRTPAAIIKTYCVSCHGGPAREGGFSFDRLDVNRPAEAAEAWERVVRQLRARSMPPMGASRPDHKTYESTIAAVTDAIDRAATPAKPLSDRELAVRIAKLIWNAAPDQPLLDAVVKGELHDARILQAQVRRMLADSKSSALVAGFFGTWLALDQLATMKEDSKLFPEFDDDLRGALRRETELVIERPVAAHRRWIDPLQRLACRPFAPFCVTPKLRTTLGPR